MRHFIGIGAAAALITAVLGLSPLPRRAEDDDSVRASEPIIIYSDLGDLCAVPEPVAAEKESPSPVRFRSPRLRAKSRFVRMAPWIPPTGCARNSGVLSRQGAGRLRRRIA